MPRSRINTQRKILQAVEDLLLGPGFTELGINAIARVAGCDKVLIYRYFGGFDGLLQSFAESQNSVPLQNKPSSGHCVSLGTYTHTPSTQLSSVQLTPSSQSVSTVHPGSRQASESRKDSISGIVSVTKY